MKLACCGLDCEKCMAYEATIKDDNKLREKVAKEWSLLNSCEIKVEDINCLGCNECSVKTPFCNHLCPIRNCAKEKKYKTCGECSDIKNCEKIKMIISSNKEALENLMKNK